MPLLNFQKRFALQVQNRTKRQTIRAKRKYPIKRGDTLYLYTGLRTNNCMKLGEEKCTDTIPIVLGKSFIKMAGVKVPGVHAHELAQADGFLNLETMLRWFRKTHGLPFKGDIITW